MNIEVYDHAVYRYINRIYGMTEDEATEMDESVAEKEIMAAVKYPDNIVHNNEEKPQIHIKRDAAVIVGVESGDGETYLPYGSLDDDLVVPSVYEASGFGGVDNDDGEKARA